jgi:predicted deacylase
MQIEKILSLPSPVGNPNHLCKVSFTGDATEDETLSIVSGLHGDQLTSLYISSCLIRFLELETVALGNNSAFQLTGNVQIFPMVNVNALENGSRLWPYDGLDMDLAFPGNSRGEASEKISRALMSHTVNSTMALLVKTASAHYHDAPHIQCFQPNRSIKKMARALGLAKARELLEESSRFKLQLFYQWRMNNIPALIISAGTAGEINTQYADQVVKGIINLMPQSGILSANSNSETQPTAPHLTFFNSRQEQKIQNQYAGLFIAQAVVGDSLTKGQKIGEVQDIYSGKIIEEIIVRQAGVLLTLRRQPLVYENELIASLAPEEKTGIWPF